MDVWARKIDEIKEMMDTNYGSKHMHGLGMVSANISGKLKYKLS